MSPTDRDDLPRDDLPRDDLPRGDDPDDDAPRADRSDPSDDPSDVELDDDWGTVRAEPGRGTAGEEEPYVRPIDRFRDGAVGSVLAAGMLGLRDVLEGRREREDVAIVGQAPAPDHEPAVDVVIDPDHPERTVAFVRRPPPSDPPHPSDPADEPPA
jgi:hypothetical protein